MPSARADPACPEGVKAIWDAGKAYRETTPTRERIYLNGLWRWQPARGGDGAPPSKDWGYFKVPGPWPGITDYMQKDCQTVYSDPSWKSRNLASVRSAWYQREMTIPAGWRGRRISVTADYVNSFATLYVDGKKAGEIRYPAGEVDITALCTPGRKHLLSFLVEAMPLKAVRLSYTDTNSARQVQGTVARRGLCGDVFLTSAPRGPRITDFKIDTSVQRRSITVDTAIDGLPSAGSPVLRIDFMDQERVLRRILKPIVRSMLRSGRYAFTETISLPKLWDLHTPQNVYTARSPS